MEPCNFKQATKLLKRPTDMVDEKCGPLFVYEDGEQCLSKWKMSWRERLHCLFKGYVWLFVHSGPTQPPATIMAYKSAFENDAPMQVELF